MNKNVAYVAAFGVLCTLAGVLVGASIAGRERSPWRGREKSGFAQRAEHFMGYGHRQGEEGKGGRLLEMLTAKLNLNQEQKEKVKQILEATRQEIEAAGKNIRGAIDAIKEKGDTQIMKVLTPAQQEQYKELQKKFQERRRFMRPRGNFGPEGENCPPPPPDETLPPPES